jgi:hypothetical protein
MYRIRSRNWSNSRFDIKAGLQGLADWLVLYIYTVCMRKVLDGKDLMQPSPARLDVIGPGYTSECDV